MPASEGASQMTNRIDPSSSYILQAAAEIVARKPELPQTVHDAEERRPAPAPGSERVALSLSDRAFFYAREAVGRAPEVRAERIAILRQRIADGSYYVPDSVLAGRILDLYA